MENFNALKLKIMWANEVDNMKCESSKQFLRVICLENYFDMPRYLDYNKLKFI